jgi:hypothetical protein
MDWWAYGRAAGTENDLFLAETAGLERQKTRLWRVPGPDLLKKTS